MADIAVLGLQVDSRPVSAASQELDKLAKSAKGAEAATKQLSSSSGGATAALSTVAQKSTAAAAGVNQINTAGKAATDTYYRMGHTIGSALISIINPASLVATAITSVGAAALAYFTSMSSQTNSTDEIIKNHAGLIRSLKDAYGEAAAGAREYAEATKGMLQVQGRAAINESQTRLRQESFRALEGLNVLGDSTGPQGMFILKREFAPFEEAIQSFRATARAGTPDVEAFASSIVAVAEAGKSNAELQKTAAELLGMIGVLRDLGEQARSTGAVLGFTSPEAILRRSTQAYQQYGDTRTRSDADFARGAIEARAGMPRPKPVNIDFESSTPEFKAGEKADQVLSSLRFEQEQLGRTNAEQRVYNELKAAGVDLNSAYGQQIAATARAIEAEQEAMKARTEATREAISQMDDLRSATSDIISGAANDLAEGKNPLRGIMANIGSRLIDSGSNLITEGFLGKTGKPGGGLLGEQVATMLGKPMSIGTATISAGSVTVMGYAPAGGGIAFPPVGGAAAVGGGPAPSLSIPGDGMVPRAFPMPGASGAPGALSVLTGGRYNGAGVDPRLTAVLQQAAATSPYQVRMTSGFRPGDKRFHGRGMATDVELIDPATGEALPNYQDGSSFRAYEQYAQSVYQNAQMTDPDLAGKLRWGGYFSGGKGKYGALDTMHFDTAGDRVPMGGGSWAGGLSPAQRQAWPGAESVGLGANPAMAAAAASADQAAKSFTDLGGAIGETTPQVGGLGDALSSLFSGGGAAVPGAAAPAGSGIGSFIGGLIPMLGGLFMAGGGRVRGAGSKTSDSIPAMLSDGEFVVNAAAVDRHGPLIEAINDNRLPRFAGGGYVTRDFDAQMGSIGGGMGPNVVSFGDTNIRIDGNADQETLKAMRAELDQRDRKRQREMEKNAGRVNTAYGKRRG